MNKKNILNRIKKIISDNNLSNSEFAEKIGIPKSSVSHLLSERNNPSLDVIIKISEIFEDISTDYLIFGYKSDKEIPTEPLNNLFDDLNKETSKDSVKAVILFSHLTDAIPYQFGTINLNGAPCSIGIGSPFIS